MSGLARRLRVPVEQLERVGALQVAVLPDPETLFSAALNSPQQDPEASQIALAAALLSAAEHSQEGRMRAGLTLLSKLVVRADPMMTLGPEGAEMRARILPKGWRGATSSWMSFRYAWREGMRHLLGVPEDETSAEDAIADALDELTRLHHAEAEPISVAIQQSWPPEPIGGLVTIVGLGFTVWGVFGGFRRERELDREVAIRKRMRKSRQKRKKG